MNARLACLALALSACAPHPTGVNGVWRAEVGTPGAGSQTVAMTLADSGGKLSGSVLGVPGNGALTIEGGAVTGDDVTFVIHPSSPGGEARTFRFTARLAGDRMQGDVEGREGQRMTFTATRSRSSPQAVVSGGSGRGGRRTARAPGDSGPPRLEGADPSPQNAEPALLAAFDRYEVVAVGILSYANQDVDQFILDLIRAPAFAGNVNDIVVECGNSLYQPILDRYVAGDSVPFAAVQQVWRNTTQPFCGVNTFYEELFPLVRQVNAALPADRKLRVLAGDPPLDWSRVRTREDLQSFGDRNASIAAVMEKDVLAKHRKALMVFGLLHLLHGGSAVGIYESAGYPGRTLVVMAHNGFGNDSPLSRYDADLERHLAGWPVPSLAGIRGTWLDDLPWGYFLPGREAESRVSAAVDAYLYLGPGDLLLNAPLPARTILDTAYMSELKRRARIRGGPAGMEMIMGEAANPAVLFNHQPGGR